MKTRFNVHSLAISLALACIPAIPALAVPDANGQLSTTPAPDLSGDAAMTARLNYNVGFERFEKAQAADKQSPGSKPALDGFRESRERFEVVVKADPNVREAWNLIGYTSRRLGEYDRSLAAYEKALAIEPNYPEAIEYRAEAYLALKRLDDVKAAYKELDVMSPAHADMLMDSMRSWVAAHRKKPDGVSATELDGFAAWVEERSSAPRQTTALRRDAAAARYWN
jgi:tetratricopeptide (TPR) repeat protein